MQALEIVELNLSDNPAATVIWLHGLGADGYDFVNLVPEFKIPEDKTFRFVFPHAPIRPITINQGYAMRAWYDIPMQDLIFQEDEAGIRDSAKLINQLIEDEHQRGQAYHRIVLAGFSQGGAMALYCGLRFPQRLGGILSLSAYLPVGNTLVHEANPANKTTPIMLAHGTHDQIVPLFLGETTKTFLIQQNYPVEWRTYPMAHTVCLEEISDIREWLLEV